VAWKSIVRESRCEVVIRHGGITHRADIVGNRNTVIELQHSPISPDEVRARERFYGSMIWVFDAAGFFGNLVLEPKDDYATVSWYYPRMALFLARKPVYLHLPCGNIFKLEHAYPKRQGEPLRGWGRFTGWKPFFHLYLSSVVKYEHMDGEQPGAIKDRDDIDIPELRFHHGARVEARCGCDSGAEYSNCGIVHECAHNDYIRQLLHI